MKQSKYVIDWWVEIINENIYCLTFNLTERWMNFHNYNDTMYSFGNEEDEISLNNIQEIPKFLPDLPRTMFVCTSSMNKDQLTYYFIPINFEDRRKNKNIILEGKNELWKKID